MHKYFLQMKFDHMYIIPVCIYNDITSANAKFMIRNKSYLQFKFDRYIKIIMVCIYNDITRTRSRTAKAISICVWTIACEVTPHAATTSNFKDSGVILFNLGSKPNSVILIVIMLNSETIIPPQIDILL